jgi:predicted protein tyrosine phosphatase
MTKTPKRQPAKTHATHHHHQCTHDHKPRATSCNKPPHAQTDMHRLPYLINAIAMVGILATRGIENPVAAVVAVLYGLSFPLLFLPALVDHVTVKAYSMILSMPSFLLLLWFDIGTAGAQFLFFWVPMVSYMRWLIFVPSYHLVRPSLYLGNIRSGTAPIAKKIGVSHIVEVHDKKFKNTDHVEGVQYLSLEFDDRSFVDISQQLVQATGFIANSVKGGGTVLVHCSAGASRSASLVLGYLVATEQLTVEDALQQLRAIRSVVDPNCGFLNQVREYANATHTGGQR